MFTSLLHEIGHSVQSNAKATAHLWCDQTSIVFVLADTSLLHDYPCAQIFATCKLLLWKTNIDRRWLMHSDEVWMHHHYNLQKPQSSSIQEPFKGSHENLAVYLPNVRNNFTTCWFKSYFFWLFALKHIEEKLRDSYKQMQHTLFTALCSQYCKSGHICTIKFCTSNNFWLV